MGSSAPGNEQVYRPDWTSPDRVNYTNRLFDLLAESAPPAAEGSVSTLPGSFKGFALTPDQVRLVRDNLFQCVEYIDKLSRRTGRKLHLGLEPEPLGLLETTAETVEFFRQIRAEHPKDERLDSLLGVNYDTCHLAIEYEHPAASLAQLRQAGIKISKLHLSSALKLRPTDTARAALGRFADNTYLHQVIARGADGALTRHKGLDIALASPQPAAEEWRVHFHIPLHSPPTEFFGNTTDHLLGVMDVLQQNPRLCSHWRWKPTPGKSCRRN